MRVHQAPLPHKSSFSFYRPHSAAQHDSSSAPLRPVTGPVAWGKAEGNTC
ncbi:hypothetical protein LDHU3_05.1380:CDS1 [Leishmania donovani]|nr:hypothetical protein LDHU3_05.1380:CDS1 [Leishmania donovani]